MSAKYVINQIHRFNFLAVNDFRVNLRSLYVGMAEQFARGIKIRTEGKHHCGERVAARVIGDFLLIPAVAIHLASTLLILGSAGSPAKTCSPSSAPFLSGSQRTAWRERGK